MAMTQGSILQVAAELPNLAVVRHFVEEMATGLGFDCQVIEDMLQAVEEAAANTILHGYSRRPGEIQVKVQREGDELVVRLRDQAPHFDPTGFPPPDLTLPLEERKPGGLGIHLMRQFTDMVTYRVTSDGSNELTLVKKQIAA
jgi:anti-sigma regulatory factor (Ser/Thr protein kinase)